MTRQEIATGVRRASDNGSLTLVGILGWGAAELGLEMPPGISELVAGYIVMIGTRIRGYL